MSTIMEYSPYAVDVQMDPYPFYAWLREEHPAYYNETHDFWALSCYADVVRTARRPELFSSAQGVGPDKSYGLAMITNDPPTHTRLRKLVHSSFTPTMINQLTGRIQTIIDDLLDACEAKGEFDLIDDFAIPLPVTVIAEMLGIPQSDQQRFHQLSNDLARSLDLTEETAVYDRASEAAAAFTDYLAHLANQRRQSPNQNN